jgi:hypothetical protein
MSEPRGLIVFAFFPGEMGFTFDTLPGKAGVKRVVLNVFDSDDYYELDIRANDDLTRPWSKSFPKNTVLVVKEQEL